MSRHKVARAPLGTSFWATPTTPPKACKRCGAPIYWKVTPKGHNMPVDADGRPHPRDCAKKGGRHGRG
jgi:hypothetical protein